MTLLEICARSLRVLPADGVKRHKDNYDRVSTFAVWQAPTVIMMGFVVVGLALTWPSQVVSSHVIAACVLMAGSSVALMLVPWERVWVWWRMVVPVLDVLAVALMWFEVEDRLPSVGLLSVVPLVWLAFDFASIGVVVSVTGAGLLCLLPVWSSADPTTETGWMELLILPVVTIIVALGARVMARLLGANQGALRRQSGELSAALDLAHERLVVVDAIFDAVEAAVAFYTPDGRLKQANQPARDLAVKGGFDPADSGGEGHRVWWEDRITPIALEDQTLIRGIRGDYVAPHLEWFGETDDQIAAMIGARQVTRSDGTRLGVVVAAWDVTQLVDAIRVREDFLTTVSHELRTPLTSIIGYQEMIEDELPADAVEIRQALQIAQRNAHTLLSRLSQLLNATEHARTPLTHVYTDLTLLTETALAKHIPVLTSARLILTRELAPGIRAEVDHSRWEQVVDNLVSNATKYTRPGGSITVTLTDEGDQFILQVSDTGVGMTPEEQRQAFDRFYRAETSRSGAIQGIGVGLSIVKDIVDAHHGCIELSSTPAVGTRFEVRMPKRPAAVSR